MEILSILKKSMRRQEEGLLSEHCMGLNHLASDAFSKSCSSQVPCNVSGKAAHILIVLRTDLTI